VAAAADITEVQQVVVIAAVATAEAAAEAHPEVADK
jgi:hypothetical protein